jgi:hypothetical protein
MDLRINAETARNAVIWILNCIGVVLLLWATASYGNIGPAGQEFSAPMAECSPNGPENLPET